VKNYTEVLRDFLRATRPFVIETDDDAYMHPRLQGYVNILVFKVEFISKDIEKIIIDEWKDRVCLLRNLPSCRDWLSDSDLYTEWIVYGIRMHNTTTPKEKKDRRAFVSWCEKRGYEMFMENTSGSDREMYWFDQS